jgi:hypothetical protein
VPAWFKRSGVALLPDEQDALAALMKVKEGASVRIHIDRVRSSQWHRLYFKRCAVIGENTGISTNAVDAKTRMMAGHVELAGQWQGRDLFVPARIAFDELSADGWQAIWQGLEQAHEEMMPGISQEIAGHATW